jgi:hypothetical protein
MKYTIKVVAAMASMMIFINCSAVDHPTRYQIVPQFPKNHGFPIPVKTVPVAFNEATGQWSLLFCHRALNDPMSFQGLFDEWLAFEVNDNIGFWEQTYGLFAQDIIEDSFENAVKVYDKKYDTGYQFIVIPFIRGQRLYNAAQKHKATITSLMHGSFIDNFAWIPENKVMDPQPGLPVGIEEKYPIKDKAALLKIWPMVKQNLQK